MTNAEKYLKDKDNVSVEEFSQKLGNYIKSREMNEPTLLINDFLNMKIKPTLTEDERVILRNIKPYTHIYRDGGNLFVLLCDKEIDYSNTKIDWHIGFKAYNHLFQFIKERRRIRDKGVTKWVDVAKNVMNYVKKYKA